MTERLQHTIHGADFVYIDPESQPIPRGVIGITDGRIAFTGTEDELKLSGLKCPEKANETHVHGGILIPGLIDSHTHVVFGGERSGEYCMRAQGKGYLEIAAAGGGILSTVRATRSATEAQLIDAAIPRLDRMLSFGVTTVEAKSGYGLDLQTEVKILRAIKALNELHPVDLVPTFLGAHTLPPEHRTNRQVYIDQIIQDMLPAVAQDSLARFCDVFVEEGAFTISEAQRIFSAARSLGLMPKIHADQLSWTGGAELAGQIGAVSADHLEYITPKGIKELLSADVVAVLLPGAYFFLGQSARPPARALLDAGVKVALATDCNPGTSMTQNLPLMMTLGMSDLGMSLQESFAAVTVNAAHAIGAQRGLGTLHPGSPADIVHYPFASLAELPYQFGAPTAQTVFKSGREVYRAVPLARQVVRPL